MAQPEPSRPANRNAVGRRFPPIPGGSARELVRDPLNYYQTITREHGNIVFYRPAPDPAYLITHPDDIQHVLVENHRNYTKNTYSNQAFFKVIGEGLITSEGNTWLQKRRLMQPAFHHARLAQLDRVIVDATRDMLESWQGSFEEGQPVDIAREMAALTMTITGRVLFGVEMDKGVKEIGEVINRVAGLMEKPKDPRLKEAAAEFRGLVDDIIRERKRDFEDKGDLLSSLILARDEETGERMDDEQLSNEATGLLLAGHETTANALTWTWFLLSQNPWAFERLRDEVRSTLDGRSPTSADLKQMPYIDMVFNEGLRMYPPAWIIGRRAISEDEVGGYYVAPNTVMAICIYTLHRHPDFWEEPEAFDPERFSPERSAGRHRHAFMPFSIGPRQCIGNTLSTLEAGLIIACVAQQFELWLMPGIEVKPQPLFVLRPNRDLLMSLHW